MADEGPTTVGSINAYLELNIDRFLAKAAEARAVAAQFSDRPIRATLTADTRGAEDGFARTTKAADTFGKSATNAGNAAGNAARGAVPWMGILVGAISAVSPGIVAVGAASVAVSAELTGLGLAGALALKGIQTGLAANLPMFNQFESALTGVQDTLTNLEMTAAGGLLPGLSAGMKTLQGDAGVLTSDVALLSAQLGGMLATAADIAVHAIDGFRPVLVATGGALQQFLQGIDAFTTSNGFTDFVNYAVARLPDVMHLIGDALGSVGALFSALAPGGQAALFLLSSVVDLVGSLAPLIGSLMPLFIGVADAVGGVALALSKVLDFLGPLGPILIEVSAAFIFWGPLSGVITAVASALETAGTAIFVAADAAGVAAPAMRFLGVAVDSALGPIGLLVIGATLLAGALMQSKGAAAAYTDITNSLKDSLQQSNGAIDLNTKTLVAQNLVANGTIDAGRRLGLTAQTVTNAAIGNAAAQKQVTAAIEAQKVPLATTTDGHRRFYASLTAGQQAAIKLKSDLAAQNSELQKATDAYNKVAQATGGAKVSTQQMAAAAAAVHMPVSEFASAAAAQQKAADTAQKTRDKYILLGDAANLLKLDLDSLNGATITNAEAQAAWASGIDSLAAGFNKTSKSITGNSNAAVENRGAIASLVSVGETALEQTAQTTHSVSATTAAYKSMRTQLINQISAITGNKKAAADLVDQYFKIPKNIKTDFRGNDADAKAKAAAAKKAAEDFAHGDYKAAYKADPTPANKAKADAMRQAQEFANGHYLAHLLGDHVPASRAAQIAKNAAQQFAQGRYQAALRADNSQAIAAAQSTVSQINAMVATIQVQVNQVGGNGAQVARNAAMNFRGATGGTAGSTSIGSMDSFRGMASGGSPSSFAGTVNGPGSASSDLAGLFRLANGEEVISNLFGQADRFRPLLKAINSGRLDYRTFEQIAGRLTGGRGAVKHTTIAPAVHIYNPVAVDPITQVTEAVQYTLAYAGLGN